MRRAAAFALMVTLPIAGCALVGYNFDGYGPASAGEGGAPPSGEASSSPSSSGSGGAPSGSGSGGSSASSGSSSASAGGSPPECMMDADCAGGTECKKATCAGDTCVLINEPPGTTCGIVNSCNSAGECVFCQSPVDCGTDNECAMFSCSGGACGVTPSPEGTACNGGSGKCDKQGSCVPQCLTAGDCPQPTRECLAAVCVSGVCGIVNLPRKTLCNNQMDQCDGAGNCVECVDSGGCGECCVCLNGSCIPAIRSPRDDRKETHL